MHRTARSSVGGHAGMGGLGRVLLFVMIVSALTLVAAACSSPDPTATPVPPAAPAPTATTAPGAAEPTPTVEAKRRGGVIQTTFTFPETLDTAFSRCTLPTVQGIFAHVHDTLIGRPSSASGTNPMSHEIEGYLAESWEARDARTYAFTLRENARFANVPPVNGRRVTSEDVKFSLLRYRDGDECVPEAKAIASIDIIDERTVVINLDEDFAPWLDQFANVRRGGAWILPKEAGTPNPDAPGGISFNSLESFIGAGPFIVESMEELPERVRYIRNPDFYDNSKVYIDAIEGFGIPDYATQLGQFIAGDIDLLSPDIANVDDIRANPDFNMQNTFRDGSTGWYFNLRNPPFDDVRVRRAISLIINQDEYITAQGGGLRRCGLMGTDGLSICDELDPENAQWWEDDIERAKALLAEAGFPDGFETTINLSDRESLYRRYRPELMAAQLAKGGIIVTEIERVSHPLHLRSYLAAGEWSGIGITTGGTNTEWNRITALAPDHLLSFGGMDDPRINERIAEYKVATDRERQKELLLEIGNIAASEVYAMYMPLEPRWNAWNKRLNDFQPILRTGETGRQYVGVWLDE